MIPYSNNDRIVQFFHKAQNKIAQLGTILANELEDEYDEQLLLGLSDFLESLDSPYNNWTEIDILRYIDFWDRRANLTNIPYIQITGYQVIINTGSPSSLDLSGIEAFIKQILATYPHNSLAGLQGGTSNERYHNSKAMYDWIQCQMQKTPCPDLIQPSVALQLVTNTQPNQSGFYELGTSVSATTLQGSFILNSGSHINSYSYLRGSTVLSTTANPSTTTPVPPYTDNTLISNTTTFIFKADFTVGGIKQATQTLEFRQPLYYGVLRRDTISNTTAAGLTKLVGNKGTLNLLYSIPANNTLLPYGQDRTAVVFIPKTWGLPTSIINNNFDFITDWDFSEVAMPLANGSTLPGYLGIYTPSFEGDATFTFNY